MVSYELFEELLPKICSRETSSRPERYTPKNPLMDHCVVVSLVAQNLFGGELMRAVMEDGDFHCWNLLPDGTEKDFTASKFQGKRLILTVSETNRNYILYEPGTCLPREIMKRYKLLSWRLIKALEPTNNLFDDPIYQDCFFNALDSPCQKMKFGCVIIDELKSEIVYEGCNKPLEPLKSVCEPNCIRLGMPSSTDSMLGVCGHAEEIGIWDVVRHRINLLNCSLYAAGLFPNCLPYIKNEPFFYCLRCAVPLYLSGIKRVYVPVVDHWEKLTGEECVKTARAYAMKEKTI